jgi:cell wall-associated NlpC family hydrolase
MNLKEVEKIAQEYAKEQVPKESCGLIITSEDGYDFIKCENIHEEPEKHFKIDSSIMLKYSKVIYSIFHSHIESNTPAVSLADIKLCESWDCIGSIVFLSERDNKLCSDLVFYGDKVIYNNLIGRPFYYNVFDCFTLIKDYYYTKLNISLDYVYSDYGWWGETEHKDSLYLSEYTRLGLEEIDIRQDLKIGDILVMKLGRSKCLNHGAIYVGNNKIIHHLEGKLSCSEAFGKYADRIQRGLRYIDSDIVKKQKVIF